MSSESSHTPADLSDFGANEWLVDELYQKYLEDPETVDKAWWSFFADYQPGAKPAQTTPVSDEAPPAAPPAPAAAAPVAPPAKPAESPKAKPAPTPVAAGAEEVRLRGVAAKTVTNMEASLTVPTATSVRAVPAKLLIDNRIVINNHLKRGRGGKVSFTHLIGYAIVKALLSLA